MHTCIIQQTSMNTAIVIVWSFCLYLDSYVLDLISPPPKSIFESIHPFIRLSPILSMQSKNCSVSFLLLCRIHCFALFCFVCFLIRNFIFQMVLNWCVGVCVHVWSYVSIKLMLENKIARGTDKNQNSTNESEKQNKIGAAQEAKLYSFRVFFFCTFSLFYIFSIGSLSECKTVYNFIATWMSSVL